MLRLRADGKQVIGFGDAKTPEPFVASCTRFFYLDDEKKATVKQGDKSSSTQKLKGDTKLMNLLRNAVEATADEDGWACLGPVGDHLQNQGPVALRNYGFSTLSELFASIDSFEIKKRKNGKRIHPISTRSRSTDKDSYK